MAAVRATYVPAGAPRTAGPPPAVRYATQAAWPGIATGFDARCHCSTWAMHNGAYQVKYAWDACDVHRGGVSP